MIFGLVGNAGSGKDTVAKFIQNYYIPNKIVRLHHLADPIKRAVAQIFGWSDDFIYNHKETIDPLYGISPRQALQSLGTDWAQFTLPSIYSEFEQRVGRNLWVMRLLPELNNNDINVICDIRFPHEVETLRTFPDFYIIKIIRPNNTLVVPAHVSENNINDITEDFLIINDGDLESLQQKVYAILNTFYTVYISGAISNDKNYKEKFIAAEQYLLSKSMVVVNPVQTTPNPTTTWQEYMKFDLQKLLQCNAIYMLKGWENSRGATLEHMVAKELGYKIFYEGDI